MANLRTEISDLITSPLFTLACRTYQNTYVDSNSPVPESLQYRINEIVELVAKNFNPDTDDIKLIVEDLQAIEQLLKEDDIIFRDKRAKEIAVLDEVIEDKIIAIASRCKEPFKSQINKLKDYPFPADLEPLIEYLKSKHHDNFTILEGFCQKRAKLAKAQVPTIYQMLEETIKQEQPIIFAKLAINKLIVDKIEPLIGALEHANNNSYDFKLKIIELAGFINDNETNISPSQLKTIFNKINSSPSTFKIFYNYLNDKIKFKLINQDEFSTAIENLKFGNKKLAKSVSPNKAKENHSYIRIEGEVYAIDNILNSATMYAKNGKAYNIKIIHFATRNQAELYPEYSNLRAFYGAENVAREIVDSDSGVVLYLKSPKEGNMPLQDYLRLHGNNLSQEDRKLLLTNLIKRLEFWHEDKQRLQLNLLIDNIRVDVNSLDLFFSSHQFATSANQSLDNKRRQYKDQDILPTNDYNRMIGFYRSNIARLDNNFYSDTWRSHIAKHNDIFMLIQVLDEVSQNQIPALKIINSTNTLLLKMQDRLCSAINFKTLKESNPKAYFNAINIINVIGKPLTDAIKNIAFDDLHNLISSKDSNASDDFLQKISFSITKLNEHNEKLTKLLATVCKGHEVQLRTRANPKEGLQQAKLAQQKYMAELARQVKQPPPAILPRQKDMNWAKAIKNSHFEPPKAVNSKTKLSFKQTKKEWTKKIRNFFRGR